MIKKNDLKILLALLFLTLFQSGCYMLAKITPFEYTIVNINFDNYIPFIPYFVYPYILWYITLFLVPFLFYKKEKIHFDVYVKTLFITVIIVFFIYFFFPTTLVRDEIIVNNISSYIVNLIYKVDTPALNCLPSMHCYIAFLHLYITPQVKGLNKYIKILIIIQSILVVLSTLFIKQHVILDVISSLILSIILYIIINFYVRKKMSSAKS